MRDLRCVLTSRIGPLAAAIVLICSGALWAQASPGRLSPTVLSADPPSAQQIQELEQFVAGYMKILCTSDSAHAIAEARQRLLEPIRSNLTSASTREAIVRSIAAALARCGDVKDPSARLNLLIVGSETPDPVVAKLAESNIHDPNPALRYWAAKALAEVAGTQAFAPEQQQQVLAALKKAMTDEQSDVTLEQMARAMGALSIPEAQRELINVIGQRVSLFVAHPNEGVRIDRKALADLQTRLAIQEANGQDIAAATRQLLIVTAKYAKAVAQTLMNDRVSESVRPHAVAMIETADEIFRFGIARLDGSLKPGPDLKGPARQGERRLLMLNVLEWTGTPETPGVLNQGQIAIPAAELQIEPPPAATPAAAPAPAKS